MSAFEEALMEAWNHKNTEDPNALRVFITYWITGEEVEVEWLKELIENKKYIFSQRKHCSPVSYYYC